MSRKGVDRSSEPSIPLGADDVASSTDRALLVRRRRQLLNCEPGDLRDLDAAAECGCGCHPQVGRRVHGDALCPCQMSQGELRAWQEQTSSQLVAARAEFTPIREMNEASLAAAASEHGVRASEESPGAPWIIRGLVDGRAFYMRERWDRYIIAMAAADRDDVDPWGSRADSGSLTIQTGTLDELDSDGQVDYAKALSVIVGAIRSHQRRVACTHRHGSGDRYCSACGLALVDPALP